MTPIRIFLSRILDLVFSGRRERRLEEEIRTHLDLLTGQYVAAGMSTAEAQQAARRSFGGVDQIKEAHRDQRGLPLADAIGQDVRFALRLMRRNPGFAVTAVLVLGVGIGVNNMLFTILNAHTLRGLPIPGSHRVLFLSTVDDRGRDRGLSMHDYEDVAAGARLFQAIAAFRPAPIVVAGDGHAAERLDGTAATANAFAVIGVRPVIGRLFTAADDQPGAPGVVLLSESAWTARYGDDAAALGRSLTVDGAPATVIGVIPDRSGFPNTATIWRPLRQTPGLAAETRDQRTLQVFGRVADGARIDDARAEVSAIGDRLGAVHPATNKNTRVRAVPINDRVLGRPTDTVWMAFMATGFIVLLISAANVANLMIDRSLLRTRELAIRASVGGTAGRLVRQLLVEGMVMAGAGAALGLLVAIGLVRGFRRLIPADALPYWLEYSIDERVLAALIGVSALTVLVFALVPALQASKTNVIGVLKDGGRSGSPGRRRILATTFLAAQIALSVVLLAQFAVTLRNQGQPLASDVIFDRTDILTASVTLPDASYPTGAVRAAFYGALIERIRRLPGIDGAAVTTVLPASGGESLPFIADGSGTADEHAERTAVVIATTPGYFQALGLELLQGRTLQDSDGAPGQMNAIVNERFVETAFPGESALGRRISLGPANERQGAATRWLTVVGVAPQIHQQRGSDSESIVYLPIRETAPANVSIMVRSPLDTASVVATLRAQLRAIDPGLPIYRARTLPQVRHDAQWNGRVSSRLLTFLTFTAVFLATIGLYAVTSHSVNQERQEIGIRLALGAQPVQIVGRVLRRLAFRTGIGFGAGVLLTGLWTGGFQSGAPGVHATDPGPLAVVAGILMVVIALAAIIPSRRACRVDPLVALRTD
jgi:putative ABC transport system permease protein